MPRAPRKRHFPSSTSSRRWSIVLNNPTQDEYNSLREWYQLNKERGINRDDKQYSLGLCRYIIISTEHANQENKTVHWQGYTEFVRPQRLSYFKKLRAFKRAHLEPAYASAEKNRRYCTKEAKPWIEEGQPGGRQGRRTDLEECKTLVDSGVDEVTVAMSHFGTWVRYNKSLKAYRQLIVPRRKWKTEVIVRWGPAGTGKSRWVWENVPDVCDMWYRNGFWSPYNNEEDVLWDDFDSTVVSRQEFLTLTDRYPAKIRQMNGWAEWVPKRIFITSNTDPASWYGGDKAVMRRLSKVSEISITSDTSVTDTE